MRYSTMVLDDPNLYTIVVQKEELRDLGARLETMGRANQFLLEEILARENSLVTIGYDYSLQSRISEKTGKLEWSFETVPRTKGVQLLLHQWRYNGIGLEQPKDICNDSIKYTMKRFSDVIRLNHDLILVGKKYLTFLRDTLETRTILEIFLRNLQMIHCALEEVSELTQDRIDIAEDEELICALDDAERSVNVIAKKLSGTSLNILSNGFIGVPPEKFNYEDCAFAFGDDDELSDIESKLRIAGTMNTEKLEVIQSRIDDTIPTGYSYTISCELPYKGCMDEQFWRTKTITRAQRVRQILDDWRYHGAKLVQTDIISKNGMDYTFEKYSDIERLNDDLLTVGLKSTNCLADKTETRDMLQAILRNLELLNEALTDLETATDSELESVEQKEVIKEGMLEVISGFDKVYHSTDEITMTLHATGCLGEFVKVEDSTIENLDSFAHQSMTRPHESNINSLQHYSKKGIKYVASGSFDRTVKVWDYSNSRRDFMFEITTPVQIYALAFYELDGEIFMACGGYDSLDVLIWNIKTQKMVCSLHGHTCHVYSIAIYEKNNQSYLISGSADNSIKIWDLVTRRCIGTLLGHSCNVSALVIYELNGKTMLASASGDCLIKVWDVDAQSLITTLVGHLDCIYTLTTFTKGDITYLASGSQDKSIKIWNLSTNELESTLPGDTNWVWSLAVCSVKGNPCLVSGGYDGSIKLWDMSNFSQIKTLLVPDASAIRSLTAYCDNTDDTWYIVSGHNDGSIMCWAE